MPTPKPKPTKIKELEGNPSRRPINKDEPQYTKIDFKPPPELDKIGKAEWAKLIKEMRQAGTLTKVDEGLLIAYCDEFATLKKAMAQMKKKGHAGLTIKSPSGYPILNPLLSIKRKSSQTLKMLASELGLSPTARGRVVAVPTEPDSDPYEELKKKRDARLIEARNKFKKK